MHTTLDWTDFNTATTHTSFALIPRGTIAKVRMHLLPGQYHDESFNWAGGYATKNTSSGVVSIYTEFTILQGTYIGRKVWGKIGLYSPKGPAWAKIGHEFTCDVLNSAFGFKRKDFSIDACNARKIKGFEDLQGIEFAALIDIEKDKLSNADRNVIKEAITPDHGEYKKIMGISEIQHTSTKELF